MKYKNYFLLLLFSLTACASNQWKTSEIDETFVTDIKVSGLKIFNYSLINTRVQASEKGKPDRGGKGNSKQGGGRDMGGSRSSGHGGMGGAKSDNQSTIKAFFNNMLEARLKKSGYCRQGFIELESSLLSGQLQMRGECEEGATDEDRIKFANRETRYRRDP